jgi:hypothetical protein
VLDAGQTLPSCLNCAGVPATSSAHGSVPPLRPDRESASDVVDAATIIPSTESGVSAATQPGCPCRATSLCMCRWDTVPAISASSTTHPVVVRLIQLSARRVTAAPEDLPTRDDEHVLTWRLAPRIELAELDDLRVSPLTFVSQTGQTGLDSGALVG